MTSRHLSYDTRASVGAAALTGRFALRASIIGKPYAFPVAFRNKREIHALE
jgi:hypothetical protein